MLDEVLAGFRHTLFLKTRKSTEFLLTKMAYALYCDKNFRFGYRLGLGYGLRLGFWLEYVLENGLRLATI